MSPSGREHSGWEAVLEQARQLNGGAPHRTWMQVRSARIAIPVHRRAVQFEKAMEEMDAKASQSPPAHYLNVIATDPAHQRKGYGRALMEHHLALVCTSNKGPCHANSRA
jgi:ribosomal protein S18 acetylase RimI-like enzyme